MKVALNIYIQVYTNRIILFVIATFWLHSIFKEDQMYQNGMEWIRLLVLKTTFNNVPVLLVEESNVLKENLRLATSHCQTASLNAVLSMPYHGWNFIARNYG